MSDGEPRVVTESPRAHFFFFVKLTRYDNPKKSRALVEACISKYGFAPEHTYDCFIHSAEDGWKPVFFMTEEGYGLMAYFISESDEWSMVTDPLAPPETRAEVLAEFLRLIFAKKKTEGAYLQCEEGTRKKMLKIVSAKLNVRRPSEDFIWPILDLSAYTSDLLGPRMKSMRNVRTRFLREHTLKIVDAHKVPKEDLHELVKKWKKNRPATHRAYAAEYHALIDAGFKGTTGAIAFIVDGKAEALSAGWPVPNSECYYHSLALHTYTYWGLGEMLMLESLSRIKKEKYALVNLGGSDKNLLSFKKKFGNVTTYKTQYFSVVRR